jgi:hypothetical protein
LLFVVAESARRERYRTVFCIVDSTQHVSAKKNANAFVQRNAFRQNAASLWLCAGPQPTLGPHFDPLHTEVKRDRACGKRSLGGSSMRR